MVSKGFANLFTLAKADLEETLKHYPDAKRILNAKVLIPVKNTLDRDRAEPIIKKIICDECSTGYQQMRSIDLFRSMII